MGRPGGIMIDIILDVLRWLIDGAWDDTASLTGLLEGLLGMLTWAILALWTLTGALEIADGNVKESWRLLRRRT